ncbi:hypothetical protein DXA70_06450 [Faecalibacterium sp. OF04-11AC]|uniref:beta-sandwich lipoprotein n=1 Tax=Faecalibacterium sp. OF04-11AC TaxID=2293109 RepID=UPI000E88282A|nr:hypothetical protein [Faecalibacterium sp. OF04-11AC]RGF78647.1 hypothetical protein DXA70_06450 [Faecalibacterium sp. OF04-11AC]DAV74293.1 MAG TPA: putative peptidyl-prolyl cis-trans isomerase [Caudoviricetes sp.]
MSKNRIACLIMCLLMLLGCIWLCGCSEADKVNANISKQADYFETERRITVYNARTDKIILEAEGLMAISNNSENELVCTVKTGPSTYKKNYIYLNDYTMYVVEDITGTTTDPYHYKMYFHTDVLPDVDVRS